MGEQFAKYNINYNKKENFSQVYGEDSVMIYSKYYENKCVKPNLCTQQNYDLTIRAMLILFLDR